MSELLFRFGIAAVFFYFGLDAVRNPEIAAGQWIRPELYSFISSLISITFFMIVLGVIQILVSVTILFGICLKKVLPIAALLLVGIIVNLGFNDIALRDFALLTGVLYMWSREKSNS